MIILDMNVVSELMRGEPLYLTTLTLGEIRYGIAVLPAGRRRTRLSVTIEDGIRPLFGARVLAFDESASVAYAEVRATARAAGQAIGNAKASIAASAPSRRFAVATHDVAPFRAARLQSSILSLAAERWL